MKRFLFLLTFFLAGCAGAGNPVDPITTPTTAASGTPATRPSLIAVSPTLLTVTPTLEGIRVSEIDGMEQIYIPAGSFNMGADDKDAKDTACRINGVACPENPVNSVYVAAFWIDKYETTNYQYSLCVEARACSMPRLGIGTLAGNPIDNLFFDYYINPSYADYPVVYVDFYMARNYCAWAGRRLPTEAEWEKAARGTDGRKYTWGNDPIGNDKGNFCDGNCPKTIANKSYDDGYAITAKVGSYPAGASPYGVMDMAGNVWEWVDTIPMDYPYNPEDGREEPDLGLRSCYPPSPCAEDEVPFGAHPERVWRGGTWSDGVWWMRVTVRYHSVPGYYHNSLGFRCAASE